MIIYDIGANNGNFTQLNIPIYQNAKFILVEANPNLCNFLNEKFANSNNIIVLNRCISEKDNTKIKFYVNNTCDGISTACKKWIQDSRFKNNFQSITEVDIDSISIDSLIEQYGKADYIKIDVEGYENIVIRGMNRYQGLLSFEWAEEMKTEIKESLHRLNSLGYENFYILSGTDYYSFMPQKSDYIDYDSIIEIINAELDEKRCNKWGMIFTY